MNEPTPGPGPHPPPRRPLATPAGASPAQPAPYDAAVPPGPAAPGVPPHGERRADAAPAPAEPPAETPARTGPAPAESGADGPVDAPALSEAGEERPAQDDVPRPLGLRVEPTGHPSVDAQLRRLEDADHLAVSGHLEVYEDVHRGLRGTLSALDRQDPHPRPYAHPHPHPRS